MQGLKSAAHSFSLIAIFSVSSAIAQKNSQASYAIPRGPAITIEKVNKRPESALQKAIKEYEGLVVENPSDPVVLNNLGANYFMSGRYYEAQSLIRKAAALAPNSLHVKINLAIVQNRVYNPSLAITTLEEVIAKSPAEPRAQSLLCELYGQEKRNREAAQCYDAILRARNLDADGASNYGVVLLELDQVERALDMLWAADVKFPNDPGIKNGLGVALFRKKKYSQAEEQLVRAVELEPNTAQLRFNLAMAQVMTQNRGSVLEQYKFLKSADPDLAEQLYKLMFRDKLVFVGNK